MGYAPHHLASQGASPRGEAAKRLTIFTSLCVSTMRQGEATKWLNIFAEENFACKILCRQGEALECCRKMKFAEFFSGKGKDLKEIIFYKEKGGFLYAKNM